jgi:cupin 2 domain-containing protein
MIARDGTDPMDNIYASLPEKLDLEDFRELLSSKHVRIERIVSQGHATPAQEWLDQDHAEWVILLRGSARLLFEDENDPRVLAPGDYANIPAHRRHRVAWTSTEEPTVWLAVRYG